MWANAANTPGVLDAEYTECHTERIEAEFVPSDRASAISRGDLRQALERIRSYARPPASTGSNQQHAHRTRTHVPGRPLIRNRTCFHIRLQRRIETRQHGLKGQRIVLPARTVVDG